MSKLFTAQIKSGELPPSLRRKAPRTWEFPIEDLEPGQYMEITIQDEGDMESALNSARALTWRTRRQHPGREFRVTKLSETMFAIWRLE